MRINKAFLPEKVCSSRKAPGILAALAISCLLVSALFVVCVVALPDGQDPRTASTSTLGSSSGFEQNSASFTDRTNVHKIAPRNINEVYGNSNVNNPFGSSSTYTRTPQGSTYSSGSKQPDIPVPPSHSIHPTSSARQNVDIKILPLPIPIGLPTPVYFRPSGYGHNNYGYGNGYTHQYESHANFDSNPYGHGLFSGFGNDILGASLKKVALGQK
ncbi:hypothetical protein TCAL_15155, partial [Tigriopus californicus]